MICEACREGNDVYSPRCENGHAICDKCAKNISLRLPEERAWIASHSVWEPKEEFNLWVPLNLLDGYLYMEDLINIPASCCPICLHEKVSEKEAMRYLLHQMGVSDIAEAAKKLQKQYATREDFLKVMGDKK